MASFPQQPGIVFVSEFNINRHKTKNVTVNKNYETYCMPRRPKPGMWDTDAKKQDIPENKR